MKLTKTSHIHTKFYVLEKISGFQKWRNSIYGSDESEIFIYKVELIHNSTNAKEQKKSDKSMPSKKSLKVSFVTSDTQKRRGFSVFGLRGRSGECYSVEVCLPKNVQS